MKQKQTQKLALNRFENEVEVSPKITNLVLLCEQIDKNSIDPYSFRELATQRQIFGNLEI